MKKFSLKTLVLPTLLFLAGWLLDATPAICSGPDWNNSPTQLNSNICDLPAPTNFHVTDIGYDYISVEWDAVTLAQAYYVEARTSNGGQLVASTTTAGTFATLQTGPGTFDLKVAAIGPGCLNPSIYSGIIPDISTMIIDLIVTGRAAPEDIEEIGPDYEACYVNQENDDKYWFRVYYLNTLIGTFEIDWNVPANPLFGCPIDLPVTVRKADWNQLDVYIHDGNNDLPPCAKGRTARIKLAGLDLFDLGFNSSSDFCVSQYQDPELYSYSVWKIISAPPPPPGDNSRVPATSTLIQNPFDAEILVRTPVPVSGPVRFQLFNLNGNSVLDQEYPAGQQYNLPTAGLPPGFYLLRMESAGVSRTYKVVKAQ